MALRIYFVGAHSTGKTTLARWTSQHFSLPLVSEVARTVLAEREIPLTQLRHRVELMGEVQLEIFRRQVEAERKLTGSYVSDRAFDSIMYMAEHALLAHHLFETREFQEYLDHVRRGVVFFVRPFPALLAEDGLRDQVAWDSVLRIDGAVKCFMECLGIPYVPITPASMQERIHIVRAVLDPRFALDAHLSASSRPAVPSPASLATLAQGGPAGASDPLGAGPGHVAATAVARPSSNGRKALVAVEG